MRNMKPVWPRYLGFFALAGLLWWGSSALEPDADRIRQLSYQSVGERVIGALPSTLAGDDGKVRVGELRVDGDAGCRHAIAGALDESVTQVPDSPWRLAISCGDEADQATLRVTLSHPVQGQQQWAWQDVGATGEPEPTRHTAVVQAATPIPDYTSLLPPLLAVLVALFTRKVLLSLLAAICLGALLVEDGSVVPAFQRTVGAYVWQGATAEFNLHVFGFTLVLIGTVHVCIAMGGMQGIINLITRAARSVRSTQIATALMGLAVFFDDYANSVIVGSSARPLTDAQRISREKLAYIVDSTAAPIAGVAVISTWIGYEIGLFNEQVQHLESVQNGYEFFFEVLPYRFYCYFAIAMVFIVAISRRDFGPMRRAERRAALTGQVAPAEARSLTGGVLKETVAKDGVPQRWFNGIVPILVVLIGAFLAFILIGRSKMDEFSWTSMADLGEAFRKVGDDNVAVLFWAGVGGAVMAFGLAFAQRLLKLHEALKAFVRGVHMMLPAIAILILAIGIRQVTVDLGTDRFLAGLLQDVPLGLLPLLTFLLAAFVAFSTGTSWGTMGILLPVAVPLAAELSHAAGGDELIIILVAGSVLDGAIFGDHCSLISDTTVMSSMACSCEHVEHVRTQIPYALVAMLVAASCYLLIGSAAGVPAWLCYLAGLGCMVAWMLLRGRPAVRPEELAEAMQKKESHE